MNNRAKNLLRKYRQIKIKTDTNSQENINNNDYQIN